MVGRISYVGYPKSGIVQLVLGLSLALIISNVTMMLLLGRGPELHTGFSRLADMCGCDPYYKDTAARLLYSPAFRQQDDAWCIPARRQPYRIFSENEPSPMVPAPVAPRSMPGCQGVSVAEDFRAHPANPESRCNMGSKQGMAPVSAMGRNINVMYF